MEARDKKQITKFLGNIGKDDVEDASIECNGREFCPRHKNCGICRFEYMQKKGWLK